MRERTGKMAAMFPPTSLTPRPTAADISGVESEVMVRDAWADASEAEKADWKARTVGAGSAPEPRVTKPAGAVAGSKKKRVAEPIAGLAGVPDPGADQHKQTKPPAARRRRAADRDGDDDAVVDEDIIVVADPRKAALDRAGETGVVAEHVERVPRSIPPHPPLFSFAALEMAAGAVKVTVKDGAIVGSAWGATGALPRLTGRFNAKPFSLAPGDVVAVVLPAYLDFLEKSVASGVHTGGGS